MPSSSKKQHNFMEAVAHNPTFAKKVGVPKSVGEDFSQADKGKKFAKGGVPRPEVEAVNKAKTEHGSLQLFSKGGTIMAAKEKNGLTTAKMGKVKADGKRAHGEHTIQLKGHTRAMMPKMAGSTTGMKKGGMAKAKK
jgi:hypothetical protein